MRRALVASSQCSRAFFLIVLLRPITRLQDGGTLPLQRTDFRTESRRQLANEGLVRVETLKEVH